jgi:hypothetical protein
MPSAAFGAIGFEILAAQLANVAANEEPAPALANGTPDRVGSDPASPAVTPA